MFENKKQYFLVILLVFGAFGLFIGPSAYTVLDKTDEEVQAEEDCLNIARALLHFYRDTGNWPYYNEPWEGRNALPRVDYLYGNMGDMPDFGGDTAISWGPVGEDMFFSLVTWGSSDTVSWYKPAFSPWHFKKFSPYPKVGWNGPYLESVTADPWGYKYLVSIGGMGPMGCDPYNHVWCLSAGPNNIVDTPAWEVETKGDDIGYRAE